MKTKVTLNLATITVDSPFEVMTHFETLRENSRWSDTGGGWRDTYRTLHAMLVEYVVSNETQEHQRNYGPYVKVEQQS